MIQWLPEEDIEPNFKNTYTSEQKELSAMVAGEMENGIDLPCSLNTAMQPTDECCSSTTHWNSDMLKDKSFLPNLLVLFIKCE